MRKPDRKEALTNEREAAYAHWLANVRGIAGMTAGRLITAFGSAEAVYHATLEEVKERVGSRPADCLKSVGRNRDILEEYDKILQKGIRFLPFWQDGFPKRLLSIPDKPVGIYVKGSLPSEDKKTIAMVGARNCSQYGTYVAKEFAKAFAEAGVEVVSGMARGIDSISQRAALQAGGASFAVFGCGVDICYPSNYNGLYRELTEKGGVLSTYAPGTLPKPELFPPRNRIISGLSDAVLVVEASLKSGTMITVDMALEQGREVYVIPGRLTDRESDGCNRLIKQGAGIVLSPEDMLREMGLLKQGKKAEAEPKMTEPEKRLLQILDFTPKSVEQLWAEAGNIPLSEMMQLLLELCFKKYALCVGGNYYIKGKGQMSACAGQDSTDL